MRNRYAVTIKPNASQDIFEFAVYIAEQSRDPDIGAMWAESVYEHICQLSNFPNSYSAYEISPYRKLIHGNYLIIYRVDDEQMAVSVCRVIHGARLSDNAGPVEG